jgi:hypothetical protein
MPSGNIKGLGIVSNVNRYILTTDDATPRAATGRLIVAAGVDAGGTYHTLTCTATGELIIAGYTALTQSNRVEEIDPISQHYVSERLANVVNGADATFDYYVDFAGYSRGGFQLALDCVAGTVTATCAISLDDTGAAPAAVAYEDVTLDFFGVASLVSAAAPATDVWLDDTGAFASAKYVRIRIVAATGGATGDWLIDHKRLY